MNIFSLKTIYAFEAIIYIALHHSVTPISGKQLASVQNISTRYLEPVMQKFVHEGILRSIRGPRGGYIFAKERRNVTARDILRIIQDEDIVTADKKFNALSREVVLPYFQQISDSALKRMEETTIDAMCKMAFDKQVSGFEISQTVHDKGKNDFVI